MKQIIQKVLACLVILFALSVLLSSVYVVNPNEYVAVRQLGKIVRVDDTPGLRFKVPMLQTIQRISSKVIIYDIEESDVITRDKKSMIADNFVLWKVVDPMVSYYEPLDTSTYQSHPLWAGANLQGRPSWHLHADRTFHSACTRTN